jgi:hypothetical protein
MERGEAGEVTTAAENNVKTDHAGDYFRERQADGHACLEAALDYLARGWAALAICTPDHVGVGPTHGKQCKHPGKAPWGPWKEYQTTLPTEEELRRKWKDNPQLNVGMTLGGITGLIGLDVDEDGGEELLRRLSQGDLPPTLEFSSGKGRRLLYRVPPGVRLKPTPKPGGEEVEGGELRLLGLGSQTVMPPSRHKASWRRYAWKPGHSPDEIDPALAPAWVIDLMRDEGHGRKGKHSHQRAHPQGDGEPIREKYRNSTLTSLGGTMRRRGMTEEEIAEALLVVNANRCDPPLSEDEVRGIAKSVCRYEPFKGTATGGGTGPAARGYRPPKPYQPFPVDALPAPLAEYVRQDALALGCDPAYLALPVLAVVASTIGNTRKIRLKPTWEEPCIIWSALIADSGTLKSPAQDKAVGHLFRVQKRLRDKYKKEMAAYKEAKKKARDDEGGNLPQEPVFQRVVCSDVTIEKLAEILEDNDRGTLVTRDELAGWLGSFSRYKQKGGTDLPNWLEMHRAGPVIVDRKTGDRKHYFVPRAAACVCGSIQPGVLASHLTAEFLESGLVARLLMAMPPALPKRWSEMVISEDAEKAYRDLLDDLLNVPISTPRQRQTLGFTTDSQEERVPVVLRLAPEAKKLWIDFYNSWAQEQAAVEGELAAAYAKLEGYAARLALLHHVVTYVGLGKDDYREIDPESVEAGIQLARWFAAEAKRIYATLRESDEERQTGRLVDWITDRGGEVTTKELQRSNSRKYPTAEAATTALDNLVEAGLGQWQDKPSGPQGGRPTRVFLLSPMASDDTDDTDETPGRPATVASDDTPCSSDDTPEASDETPQKHRENGVGSVSSVVGCNATKPNHSPEHNGKPQEVSSDELGGFVGRWGWLGGEGIPGLRNAVGLAKRRRCCDDDRQNLDLCPPGAPGAAPPASSSRRACRAPSGQARSRILR